MKHYEEPELNIIHYDVKNKIMEGYKDGDICDNPWAYLFAEDASDV